MVKVEYHNIAYGGTMNYLIEVDGKQLAMFNGKLKSKYKSYFGLKGVVIFRLTGSEAVMYEHLRPITGKPTQNHSSAPLFGEQELGIL